MGKGCLYLVMSLPLFLAHMFLIASQSPQQPWCRDDERTALWEFKESLRLINPDTPCLDSWQLLGESRNCCSWQGVECGGTYGHVIGLSMRDCGWNLYGSISSNSSLFRLVHLQSLNLGSVNFLNSQIPFAIGNLQSLMYLTLSKCNFQGLVPSSVSNLTKLVSLDVSANLLHGPIFPFISNLTGLLNLDLSDNQFSGSIASIGNLIQLNAVLLYSNKFIGEIPKDIARLTHLQSLQLSSNRLHGPIPDSLFQLRNLTYLSLNSNNLSGLVSLDLFSEMEHLVQLDLSFNGFRVAAGSNKSYGPFLLILGLAQCNLNEFPRYLENLDTLFELDLSINNITGEVPEWFLNARLPSLSSLNLSHNSLMGFHGDLIHYNAIGLKVLDLRFNKLQGSIPIPSTPPWYYLVSNNMLSGEIPLQICSWKTIILLDMSKNFFTGEIPECFSDLSTRMGLLSLHSNSFHGYIPPLGSINSTCALQMIDLSDNQLQGPLPRSLSNCKSLQYLNVGNNRINDTFPSWLGSVFNLRVLILRHNKFHGVIEEPQRDLGFPNLQIIDLSHNNFQRSLPSFYFQSWVYMSVSSPEQNNYLSTNIFALLTLFGDYPSYDFSMTIINKGSELEYTKILGYFKVVDLSSNNFTGVLPNSISDIGGLHLLNLSNNMLTGSIPLSLANLTELEALDLSKNEFSGNIPEQLSQLNFLSVFNVSYNNLSGSIPRGEQFDTFESNSYLGNDGLCGDPLPKKCRNIDPSLPPPNAKIDKVSNAPFQIEWKAVAIGYATTFVIAAVVGHKIITEKPNWFLKNFGLRHLR